MARGRALPRPRRALLWGVGVFAALQLGLALTTEWWLPGLRDREYGVKLDLLRARAAAEPDRPMVVVIGSSRVAVGLRPDSFPDDELVFNFGVLGAGPMTQHMVLQRLLRHGVRPDHVLLEVWPPVMHHVQGADEEVRLGVNRLGLADALLTSRYAAEPEDFLLRWSQDWLVPWYSNRALLLSACGLEELKGDKWQDIEADGWRPAQWRFTPEQAREISTRVRRQYRTTLPRYQMNPHADRALRDTIALCRREDIPVTLIFMPESKEFQGYYTLPVRRRIDEYLQELRRDCDVALVDCRDMATRKDFPDGFHLSPEGALGFSERFAAEVLPRLDRRWAFDAGDR